MCDNTPSRHRGTDLAATIALPAGVTSAGGLPVAVAPRGTGASSARGLGSIAISPKRYGTRRTPPLSMNGGPDSSCHWRASRELRAIAMITYEPPARLERQGARTALPARATVAVSGIALHADNASAGDFSSASDPGSLSSAPT